MSAESNPGEPLAMTDEPDQSSSRPPPSSAELEATFRQDFYSFLVRVFVERHGPGAFIPSWHIQALAAKLAAVADRPGSRLIVNIPPRHLKSLAASIALPAWLLGRDARLAIVNATYAQDLSD